jgi:Protein of unknown function (DUF3489)
MSASFQRQRYRRETQMKMLYPLHSVLRGTQEWIVVIWPICPHSSLSPINEACPVDEGSQDTIEPSEAPLPQAKKVVSADEGDPAGVAVPRDGSKLAMVVERLQHADGATIVDLAQATGWLPHTTRAALTALRKRGYAVIRELIGARGSVYRISDAPSDSGDRAVRQRYAMDGRGPKRKPMQAA